MRIIIASQFVQVRSRLSVVPGEEFGHFIDTYDRDQALSLIPSAVIEHGFDHGEDVESVVGLGVPDERRIIPDDILSGL